MKVWLPLVVGICSGMGTLIAQETITVQPNATLTWDEIRQIDQQRAAIPQARRVIPPPHEGPAPREIGNPEPPPYERPVPQLGRMKQEEPARRDVTDLPPVLSFEALPDNNTVIPPDTHGAVGPSHAMTMLNSEVRIHSKTGTVLSTVSLTSFWSSITGSKFDPKVLYDAESNRWIAVCDADAATATSKVCFAITTGSDPTGTWNFYEFDADAGNTTWADYPGFGVNATWIAITQNMFTFAGGFVGEKMWVIHKSTALDGPPLTVSVFPTGFDVAGGFDGFTLQPCQTFGTEGSLYLVDNSGLNSGGTFLIRISRITGAESSPSWSVIPGSPFAGTGLFFVANNFNFSQPDADQLGLSTEIETNDPRMLNAVFRNGHIWCTHSAGLPVGAPPPDRTSVFWYQLNPTLGSPIVQSGVIGGGSGTHYFFPSITANVSDDAVIGFTRSDATMYAQGAYAGRLGTDPPGTVMPIQLLKVGESSYRKFFGGPSNRWGDYSATVVDPVDDVTFWTIQEYADMNVGGGTNDGRWGTWWGKLDPAVSLPVQLASFTGTVVHGTDVLLEWTTLTELNNYGFEIQRSHTVPDTFQTIPNSFVPGHGTTLEPQYYSFTDVNPGSGRWWYRLKQIDLDGTIHYTEGIEVDVLTGVAEGSLPVKTALLQNYPNPFNPSTNVEFRVKNGGFVTLKVFDVLGREVATLVNERKEPGTYSVTLDASHLASGMYIYRMTAGEFVEARKFVVSK